MKVLLEYLIKKEDGNNLILLKAGDCYSYIMEAKVFPILEPILSEANLKLNTSSANPYIGTHMKIEDFEKFLNEKFQSLGKNDITFINNDYTNLVSELTSIIDNNWILSLKDNNLKAYKVSTQCVDILFLDPNTATLKQGGSGVVKHGAERCVHKKEFIEDLLNLVKNKDDYILYRDDDLSPIASNNLDESAAEHKAECGMSQEEIQKSIYDTKESRVGLGVK